MVPASWPHPIGVPHAACHHKGMVSSTSHRFRSAYAIWGEAVNTAAVAPRATTNCLAISPMLFSFFWALQRTAREETGRAAGLREDGAGAPRTLVREVENMAIVDGLSKWRCCWGWVGSSVWGLDVVWGCFLCLWSRLAFGLGSREKLPEKSLSLAFQAWESFEHHPTSLG